MPNTLHIQYKIGDIIDDILENWGDENYKVTIESFRRKKRLSCPFSHWKLGRKESFFLNPLFL